MRDLGITQDELARRTGTTQQSVSLWESRKRTPNIKLLMRIATVLGCTLDELAGDYAE